MRISNIEQGILNFEVSAVLASLLRFEIPYSIFDILNIIVKIFIASA
jgi:hypothetical protein